MSDFVAWRGGQWLTKLELQAHLAAVSGLENVGLLLGAGASVGAGGQTVGQIWDAFCSRSAADVAWLKTGGFIDAAAAPNVELLLDRLEIAASEWDRQKKSTDELRAAQRNLQRAIVNGALLKRDWWEDPAVLGEFPAELTAHTTVLRKLCSARQPGQPAPWVFSLNYDLAVEWAAEALGLHVTNGFAGVHHRTFAPQNFDLGLRNMLARGEARFGTYNIYLAKLHGSLSWREASSDSVVEEPSSAIWPKLKDWLDDATKTTFPGLLVLPSAAKYFQTAGFVLGELFRRFTDLAAHPQTGLVVCGYSFSDPHVNRALRAALQNPTLQLVVCARKAKEGSGVLKVSECGPWVQALERLGLPQVTIVFGDDATFESLAGQLPDPVLFDKQSLEIRRVLKELRDDLAAPAGPKP
jgi:hypothetical protein